MKNNTELAQPENGDFKKIIFSPKANPEVICRVKEKQLLLSFVRNGDICFLTGSPGSGKSSLLLWLAKNLKMHNLFYIDAASVEKDFSVKDFLKKARNGLDRFRAFPKNSVILLDESQDCDITLQKALKLHWDHNHLKSIVITQIDKGLKDFSISFRDRIGNRVIKLGKLSKEDAIELIKHRCENRSIFDLKTMEEITRKADYNPRNILEICELYCLQNYKKKEYSPRKKGYFSNKIKENPVQKESIQKKISNNSQDYTYKVNEANQKIVTMTQKKIILEIKKGHETVDGIAKNLEMPIQEVKNELKTLFDNGGVSIRGKSSNTGEVNP